MNPSLVPISRHARIAAIGSALLLSAAGCTDLRMDAVKAYHKGNFQRAGEILDSAAREEAGLDEAKGELAATQWPMSSGDTPLLGMERAMVYLREGKPAQAKAILEAMRPSLRDRRIGDFAGYFGIDPTTPSSWDSLLLGDQSLDYSVPSYEELATYTLHTLASLVATGEGAKAPLNSAFNFDSIQKEILKASFVLEGETLRDGKNDVFPAGHYVAGVVREDLEAPDAAKFSYEIADRGFANASHSVKLNQDALERTQRGERVGGAQTTVQVFYMLGRGPELESSRFNPTEIDGLAEAATRAVNLAIDILKKTLIDDETYKFTDGLVQNLTQAPVAVPYVAETPPLIREVDTATITAVGASNATESLQGKVEVLADFRQIAQQNLDELRLMRITRAVLRRAIKEAGLQAIDNEIARAAARLGTSIVEDADVRHWQTLPAQIRTTRIVVPVGTHEIDLGLPGTSPVTIVTENTHHTYVLVIDGGDHAVPPTVLVDPRSRPSTATGTANETTGGESTGTPSPSPGTNTGNEPSGSSGRGARR